ncbi:MAG: transposase, partial [Candidatus Angelobacter sp.]
MSDVGLVRFASLALAVSEEVLPAYGHRFSPQRFRQPQLLAILCLMRYEDWTFRAAEVRLNEHGELRGALQLAAVPHYSTLYRFMLRVEEGVIAQALAEVVRRLEKLGGSPGSQRRPKRHTVAVDATGLAPGSISTFFVRRREQHGGAAMPWRYWLKWLLAIDVDLRVVLAQSAHQGPTNDCATLRPLLDQAVQVNPIHLVVADAEFDSERNHLHIRQRLGAQSVIPAKRGKASWKLHGIRAQMRAAFPQATYRRRVHAETVFSAIKRKLSAKAPGRSVTTQCKQALLLGLAYNIYRLWRQRIQFGLSQPLLTRAFQQSHIASRGSAAHS